jgi:hypothetical protein
MDNIKMVDIVLVLTEMDWIDLAQNTDHCTARQDGSEASGCIKVQSFQKLPK